VILLQAYGVVDPGVSDVNDSEILAHAMENIAQGHVESYLVHRGGECVNEYPRHHSTSESTMDFGSGDIINPNHLLGGFPCLFPYGYGGFEVDHPHKVKFSSLIVVLPLFTNLIFL